MPMACEHNIRETLKGAGPCEINYEVFKRTGQPNWWCRTHGMEAAAPDGAPLPSCPGAWFEAVPESMQLTSDLAEGEWAMWGVIPPGIAIGEVPPEPGSVHVHHRANVQQSKDIDGSFDIVRARYQGAEVVVEGMAAVAFAISNLTGQQVVALRCPRCGEGHIDEQKFATRPHRKHLCGKCGRNFNATGASISNPLAEANRQLGLAPASPPVRAGRPLRLLSREYAAIALWPSNAALISTMSRPEESGVHVHAWDQHGRQVLDDTYSPVHLDGDLIDEEALGWLSVQLSLAHRAPILTVACSGCGKSLISPRVGWVEPTTNHSCACGASTKTRQRVFLNPLATKHL